MESLADAIKSLVAKFCIAKRLLPVLLSVIVLGALTGGGRAQDPPTAAPQPTPDQRTDSLLQGLGGLLDKVQKGGQGERGQPSGRYERKQTGFSWSTRLRSIRQRRASVDGCLC